MRSIALFIIIGLTFIQPVLAVNYTTNRSGSWSTSNTWVGNNRPTSVSGGDLITINHEIDGGNVSLNITGSGIITINLAANVEVNQFQLNNSTGTTVIINTNGYDFIVENTLSINSNSLLLDINGNFEAGALQINNNSSIDISGDAEIDGNFQMNGSGMATIGGRLYVDNNLSLNGGSGLSVSGTTEIDGQLTSNGGGILFFGDDLETENFTANNGATIIAQGDVQADGNLTLNGGGQFTVSGDLEVDGNAQLGSDLTVQGNSEFDNNVTINNADISLNGEVTTDGNVTINGGSLSAEDGIKVDGNFVVNGSGFASIRGNSTIEGFFRANDNATIQSDQTNVEGNITVNGSATLTVNGTLTTESNFTNNGTIRGSGLISWEGNFTNNSNIYDMHNNLVYSSGQVPTGSSYDFNNGALPIKLISFEVNQIDGEIVISWQTALEINNDYFEIQRSANGHSFETIATLSGAGNSTQPLNYSITDPDPLQGLAYYRLKQTDYDGQYEIFDMVAFHQTIQLKAISIYPNPTQDYIYWDFEAAQAAIFDLMGNPKTEVSLHSRSLDLTGLPSGIYILRIQEASGQTYTHRIVKR